MTGKNKVSNQTKGLAALACSLSLAAITALIKKIAVTSREAGEKEKSEGSKEKA